MAAAYRSAPRELSEKSIGQSTGARMVMDALLSRSATSDGLIVCRPGPAKAAIPVPGKLTSAHEVVENAITLVV